MIVSPPSQSWRQYYHNSTNLSHLELLGPGAEDCVEWKASWSAAYLTPPGSDLRMRNVGCGVRKAEDGAPSSPVCALPWPRDAVISPKNRHDGHKALGYGAQRI